MFTKHTFSHSSLWQVTRVELWHAWSGSIAPCVAGESRDHRCATPKSTFYFLQDLISYVLGNFGLCWKAFLRLHLQLASVIPIYLFTADSLGKERKWRIKIGNGEFARPGLLFLLLPLISFQDNKWAFAARNNRMWGVVCLCMMFVSADGDVSATHSQTRHS